MRKSRAVPPNSDGVPTIELGAFHACSMMRPKGAAQLEIDEVPIPTAANGMPRSLALTAFPAPRLPWVRGPALLKKGATFGGNPFWLA